MGTELFVTMGWQALACYVEWVMGLGGITADFEACLSSARDNMSTQSLWDCAGAFGDQYTALALDFFGCFY